jgi:hypothetical protein
MAEGVLLAFFSFLSEIVLPNSILSRCTSGHVERVDMCFSPKSFLFSCKWSQAHVLRAISKGNAMLWNHPRAQTIQTCKLLSISPMFMIHSKFIRLVNHGIPFFVSLPKALPIINHLLNNHRTRM